MVVPVTQQATQQIRATQERAVLGCFTAHHKVVAATRATVPAIEHEFLSGQANKTRFFV